MDSDWAVLQNDIARFDPDGKSGADSSLLQRQPTITRLLALADKLEATYARGRTAKLELAQVCFALADLYAPCDATKALNVRSLCR